MKARKFLLSAVILLGITLSSGCTSANDNPDDDNGTAAESGQHATNDTDNGNTDKAEKDTPQDNEAKSEADGSNDNASETDAPGDIAGQLKMDDAFVKLPGEFPVDGNVSADIAKNTDDGYAIKYTEKAGTEVAAFSGTRYESAQAAREDLDGFMDGKEVPAYDAGKTDLGHGISGYGEGAAGHAYFSWQEGNWLMSISSLTQDEMDNPGIAEKMVAYLESHMLPAPKDAGIVYVDYPQGGDLVNVDIRWQEDEMIYQLETSKVPLDALEMTVSVE
jgi:hypothetical protein